MKQRKFDYFSAGSTQGSQGSQMKIESTAKKTSSFEIEGGGKYQNTGRAQETVNDDVGHPHLDEPDLFDPNTTQTNALLGVKDKKCNLILQRIYYSDKCSYFYIGLLLLSFGLILVTIFDGFKVAETPQFIILELILNLLIGADFACRIKLVGCQKYVRDPDSGNIRWWNIFDALVVTLCNATFAVQLFSKTGNIKGFEEASEEVLIVMWCIWQTLRMILIAKKQRLARQSAKTLINFENCIVDTDFGGAVSFRSGNGEGRNNMSGDPDDIVVELANMDKEDEESKREKNIARLRNKLTSKPSLSGNSAASRFGRGASSGTQKTDFGNLQHYVIDDEEDEV